jgi:hypothetical protein
MRVAASHLVALVPAESFLELETFAALQPISLSSAE